MSGGFCISENQSEAPFTAKVLYCVEKGDFPDYLASRDLGDSAFLEADGGQIKVCISYETRFIRDSTVGKFFLTNNMSLQPCIIHCTVAHQLS